MNEAMAPIAEPVVNTPHANDEFFVLILISICFYANSVAKMPYNKRVLKLTPRKLTAITYVLGSMIVTIWTLFRFTERSIIFDTVGQQVLAHQWLQGYTGGSVIGQTNYLLKVLFVYIPFNVLHIPPMQGLIGYTIAFNVVTFCLTIFLLKKFWNLFSKTDSLSLQVAVLWFASICGSVFWIQFANSRNLEVAGGLAVAYLLLSYHKQPTPKKLILLTVFSAIVFFADVLQLYMVAIPVVIYIIGDEILGKKRGWRHIGSIAASVIVAALMAKALLSMVMTVLSVRLATPALLDSVSLQSIVQAAIQFLRLFMGGYELGKVFIVSNIALTLVSVIGAVVLYLGQAKKVLWHIVTVSFLIIIVNIGVYIVSRQATVEGSFRYLIMTAPFVVLLLVFTLDTMGAKASRIAQGLIVGIVLLSTIVVSVKTVFALANTKNPNTEQYAAIDFAKNYTFAFAGMDTALTGYFISNGKAVLLPLECIDGRLQKTNLFFDKAFFSTQLSKSQPLTPLILNNQSITNKPYTCSIDDIEKQFGNASELTQLSNGSTVLLYDTNQFLKAL